MADRYNVLQHNEQMIVLKRTGVHLGPSQVVLQRRQIAAVSQSPGTVMVATTDGRSYVVNRGLRGAQRALVAGAFGL